MKLIALGANLASPAGGPRETLESALEQLDARGVRVTARSRWWITPAFPAGSGPDYVNGAARVATDLAPSGLLATLHAVEAALGRRRAARWGARACDLDLIAWEDRELPDPAVQTAWRGLTPEEQERRTPQDLILPHPRMQDRGFVLAPLAEIAPDWRHPGLKRTIAELLAALPAEALAGMRPMGLERPRPAPPR